MRLAVVTNILAPYRIPLFEHLARRCDDFLVLLLADRHVNRDWATAAVPFATQTLPGIRISSAGSVDPIHINVGAWRALRRFQPDAVLGGGFTPAHVAAMLYCQSHDRHYVPWGELTLQHQSEKLAARRWLRRWMIGTNRSFVASSKATRSAFVHYGANPADVLVSPMPVGTATFRDLAARARADGACEKLRAHFGAPLIVSAGRLVDIKGWRNLLRAFQRLVRAHPDATLVIAGDGPQRHEYSRFAEHLQLGAHVRFIGQQPPDKLAALYAAADVFAFPTLADPYGAVLVEAMSCGTIAVASAHAAATPEFVTHGDSGFVADPLDDKAFAVAMGEALGLPAESRARMIQRANERLPADDMQHSAAAIVDFLASRIEPSLSPAAPVCHRDVI